MIKNVKWNNHESLGNLEIDFTKDDGSPYNTIILAGENGTGKSTILKTLCGFLNAGSFLPFNSIRYDINGVNYLITPLESGSQHGSHQRLNESNKNKVNVYNNRTINFDKLQIDKEDIRSYGVVYSKARAGFNTKPVKSTTTMMTDSDKYEVEQTDDYTRVKQLLIDITTQGNAVLWELARRKGKISSTDYKNFLISTKIYRFEKAFNDFFDNIKFKNVDNSASDEIRVLFKKYNKDISIDNLSSGEKQIVFRGAELLKNSQAISGGTVLIDEPELSMHPRWQKNLLKYYRGLFTNGDGSQAVQMFIATHSPYIIQSALEDKDNVLVIVLNDNNGVIKATCINSSDVLPKVTPAEVNYMAFCLPTIDYHIELYGWLQRKNGDLTVNECDNYIKNHKKYDAKKHGKSSSFIDKNGKVHNYYTLPTYIRNAIDHPEPNKTFTDRELSLSIELLRELCL